MEKMMKTPKLPYTDSIPELAQFWDAHDLMDFEEQLEEVAEAAFEQRTVISLNLESKDAEAIGMIAKTKGLETEELIYQWIRGKIHSQRKDRTVPIPHRLLGAKRTRSHK